MRELTEQQLREILASAYERQLLNITAELIRGGIRDYGICAGLDAMKRAIEASHALNNPQAL